MIHIKIGWKRSSNCSQFRHFGGCDRYSQNEPLAHEKLLAAFQMITAWLRHERKAMKAHCSCFPDESRGHEDCFFSQEAANDFRVASGSIFEQRLHMLHCMPLLGATLDGSAIPHTFLLSLLVAAKPKVRSNRRRWEGVIKGLCFTWRNLRGQIRGHLMPPAHRHAAAPPSSPSHDELVRDLPGVGDDKVVRRACITFFRHGLAPAG